jgi:hypothetical protein
MFNLQTYVTENIVFNHEIMSIVWVVYNEGLVLQKHEWTMEFTINIYFTSQRW